MSSLHDERELEILKRVEKQYDDSVRGFTNILGKYVIFEHKMTTRTTDDEWLSDEDESIKLMKEEHTAMIRRLEIISQKR